MLIRRTSLAVVATAVVAAALAAPSEATFPGGNGRIVFSRGAGGNTDIWSMRADGADQVNLTNDAVTDSTPSWSPDGQRIAFARDTNADNTADEIFVMNADGSGQTNVTNSAAQDLLPAFSPDGQRIAFSRGGDVWVMGADGSGQTDLTNNIDQETSPSFLPDGRIVYARLLTAGMFNQEIYVMNPDGSGQTDLTNNPAGDSTPDPAPDGSRILFSRIVSTSPLNFDIFTMNADGSGQADLVADPAPDATPIFSPDGARIAFARNTTSPGAFGGEIFAAGSDGSSPVNLTNTGDADSDSNPDWQATPPVTPPPPDTTPPNTKIKHRPANKLHGTTASYRFTSTEDGSTFKCKLDRKKFKPCTSPRKLKHLDKGKHKFQVEATDAAGNVDSSPAKDKFKVVD